MSTSIDERIVEMRFDNQQFENGVKTTLETLNKLKEGLNFDGAVKGLSSIASAGGALGLSSIGDSVSAISEKFSAFEQIAIGALRRIGEQAVATGERLIKDLSVDNIAAGWEKFGEKTTSVATLVAQGYDLDLVNEQLERLNWFTDETSYNFTDMVSNISKFTATGQDLQPSVTAMEGIATWAALSGQNASTASRAMYQLSQAMGKGALRYDDWKSIQNASMDTQEFRKQALGAAEALGVIKKNADDTFTVLASGKKYSMAEMFASDALTREQWFSSDVMMQVFGEYASAVDEIYEYAEEKGLTASEAMAELGDQVDAFGLKAFKAAQEARTWTDVIDSVKDAVSTGWMNTFEYVFGNQQEATQAFTWWANELYDVFAESGNKRNEVLKVWKRIGGRDIAVEGIIYAWQALTDTLSVVREEFNKAFGITADTEEQVNNVAESLLNVTTKFRDFAESIIPSEEELEELRAIAASVFGVSRRLVKIVGTSLTKAFNLVAIAVDLAKEAFNNVIPDGAIEKVFEILDGINLLISSFRLTTKDLDNISAGFEGVFAVVDIVGQAFSALWDVFSNPFADAITSIKDTVLDLVGVFGDFLTRINEIVTETDIFHTAFGNLLNILTIIADAFSEAFDLDDLPKDFGEFLDGVATNFETFANSIGPNTDKLEDFKDVVSKIFDVLSSVKDLIVTGVSVAFDNLVGIITAVKNAFQEAIPASTLDDIKAFIDSIKTLVERFRLSDESLEMLKSTFKGIFSIVDILGQAFFALWNTLSGPIGDALSSIGHIILTITSNIGEFISKLAEAARESGIFKNIFAILGSVIQVVTNIFSGLGNVFAGLDISGSGITNFITGFLNGIGEALNNVDIWNFIKGGLKFAIVGKALTGVLSFIDALGNSLTSIAKIPSALLGVLDGASNSLKALSTDLKADALLKLAEAIAILIASFWLLSTINPSGMSTAVAAMLAVVGSMVLMIKAMNSMDIKSAIASFIGFKALGSVFKDIAVSFIAMAAAIKIITAGDNTLGDVAIAAGILSGMSLVIVAFIAIGKYIDTTAASKISSAFIKMGVAFVIMAASIRILTAGNTSMQEVGIAAAILTGMSGLIMAFMLLSNLVTKAKNIVAVGVAFSSIASSMLIMAAAIRLLSSGKNVNLKDVAIAAGILAGITSLIAVLMLLSNTMKVGKMLALGATFSAMAVSVLIISAAIKLVSTIPWENALVAALGLSAVMLAMAAAIVLIDGVGGASSASTLLSMAVAITAIATALAIMAMAKVGIGQVVALGVALLVLVGVGALVNALHLGDALTAIAKALILIASVVLVVGVGVLAFAVAMELLGKNTANIPAIMKSIGDGIVAFGTSVSSNLGALAAFIAIMVVVAATAIAVSYAIGKIVDGMIVVIQSLAPFFAQLAKHLPSMKTVLIAGIAMILIGILEWLGFALDDLVSSLVTLIIIAINSLSIAILENGEAIGKAITNLCIALTGLIIEGLVGIFSPIIDAIPGARDWVDQNITGLYSDISTDMSSENDKLREQMSGHVDALADSAQTALNGVNIDPTGLVSNPTNDAKLESEAKSSGELVAGTYKSTIENADPADLAKGASSEQQKAEQRAAARGAGEAFNDEYKKTVEGANTPEVAKGLTAEDAKAEQRAAAKTLGDTYAETFNETVDEGLDPVGDTVQTDLSSIDVETPASAAGYDYASYFGAGYDMGSADVMSMMGESTSDMSSILSNPDGATASGMDFASSFGSGYDMGSADVMSMMGASATDMSSILSNPDGATTSGMDFASSFGTGFTNSYPSVEQTATGLSDSAVSGLSVNTEAATTAGQDMATAFADGMSNNETAISDAAAAISDTASGAFDDAYDTAFASGSSISFGFGAGMYSNRTAVTDAASIISDEVASKFDSGSTTSFNAGNTLMQQFRAGIESRRSDLTSSSLDIVKQILTNLNSGQNQGRLNGQTLIAMFSAGIKSAMSQAAMSASAVLNMSLTTLSSGTQQAYNAGATVATSMANGLQAYGSSVATAAANVVSYISYSTNSMYNTGYNAGANFSIGMGNGITAYMYNAINAAARVAAMAAQAARSKLKINSPSKVAAEIGKYFDLGFAQGLNQYSGTVSDAAEESTDGVISSFSAIISRIKDVLDGTIDIDPTIRPVLDLSAIQNGANQLNGMLSGSYSYAANAIGGLSGISNTDQILNGLNSLAAKLGNTRQLPNINITVNAGNVDDPDELADIISDRIQFKYAQIGASLGG